MTFDEWAEKNHFHPTRSGSAYVYAKRGWDAAMQVAPSTELAILKAEVASLQALLSMRESLGDFTDREAFTVWNGRLSKAWLATLAALDKVVPGASDALWGAAQEREVNA